MGNHPVGVVAAGTRTASTTKRPRPVVAALLLLSIAAWAEAPLAAAADKSTCRRSGIVRPESITLAVDPTAPDSTALVVSATCDETPIRAKAAEEPREFEITVNESKIRAVESYPAVESLVLRDNAIKSFKAVGTSLKRLDLTSNGISSLDDFAFPASLQRLTLDFNPIKSFRGSNFPSNLQELFFQKARISDLSSYEFPDKLRLLNLNGNEELRTLKGLSLPSALQLLQCENCRIKEIAGVTFPASLSVLRVSGTTLDSLVVRESDVPILNKVQLQLGKLESATCSHPSAKMTTIQSVSACVLDDVTFAKTYPQATRPSTTTLPKPADLSASSSSSPTPIAPLVESKDVGKNGSNLTLVLIVGGLVLCAVLIGAAIGWVFQRRRRRSAHRRTSLEGGQVGKRGNRTQTRTADQTDFPFANQSVESGFLDNDVRNDERLIPYRIPREELEIEGELATGGFGIVYRAKAYGNAVVVKMVAPMKSQSTPVLRRFMDEIRLYAKLSHPKIVRFVGLSWTNLLDLSLVMEYMPHGDLSAVLSANNKLPQGRELLSWFSPHSEPRCKGLLALDVAEALVYLHSFTPPIIHRDLKAKNVLLDEDYVAKLCDFGISREIAEETMTGLMGTTAWTAPEVLQGERYSEKADIYSFGILMCELDTCAHPYNNTRTSDESFTDAKIAYLVSTEALRPTLEDDCPPAVRKLVMKCIEFDPSKRPSAVELHYNLRKIREASLEWGFV